jgi:MraZ protein
MLLGKHHSKLDSKGRIILPAKLRGLGEQIVLVKGFDKCLYIYSEQEWMKYAKEHVENRPDEDEEARMFKSAFYANSSALSVDSQGRVNLPAEFIEYANIKTEAYTIGAISRIEIWAKEVFDDGSKNLDMGALIGNMKKYIGAEGAK